jgi:putative oxidoreductase
VLQRVQEQLTKHQHLAFLPLRVGVGIVFVAHGTMKLADPMGTTQQFASLGLPLPWAWTLLAIAGEFGGGLGLVLGAVTRLAALGLLFTTLVEIFSVHLGHGLFAANGGWEYPLVLLLVCVLFAVRGGGIYSVDALRSRARAAVRHVPTDSVQA